MKVKNFLSDVSGASRVTAARMMAFDAASPALTDVDPIGNVSREWHPGPIELVVTGIKPACKTAKTIRTAKNCPSSMRDSTLCSTSRSARA